MLSADHAILRDLVIVIVASTGAALFVGVSCLSQGLVSPSATKFDPGRTAPNGFLTLPVGTTTLASAELPRPTMHTSPAPSELRANDNPMPKPPVREVPPARADG